MSAEYRVLTVPEVPLLVPLGQEFFSASGLPGVFNPEHFVKTWSTLIELELGIVQGVFRGGELLGAAGFILTADINTGAPNASESFFYVRPQFRGVGHRLFLETEKNLKARGAATIFMVNLINSSADGHARYYQRMGYRPLENVFIKEAK